MSNVKPLLGFIAKYESGGDYNIVWGRIKSEHRPPKPLTKMTVQEVLNWQDSIDFLYMSEAAGRYQVMEDTLRDLVRNGQVSASAVFNEKMQDKIAIELLNRRGLQQYLQGTMLAEEFANRIAKEWASMPVTTGPKKGKSFYGGDGLNKSHVSVDKFLAAVRAVKDAPAPPAQEIPPANPLRAFFQALAALFSRKG